jgi:hypothetical protein
MSKPGRLAYAARKRRPEDKFIKDFEGFDSPILLKRSIA